MPPKDPYKYFRIEARELLEGLQRGVAGLTGATADPAHIPALLRLAHTLKGAARVVRLTAVSELAHRLEDVLAPSRESTLPVPAEQVAELQRLLEGIAAGLVVLDRPAGPAGAAGTSPAAPAVPPLIDTVRLQAAEVDSALSGVAGTAAELAALRAELQGLDRSGQQARRILALATRGRAAEAGVRLPAEAAELVAQLDGARQRLGNRVERIGRDLQRLHEDTGRLRLIPTEVLWIFLEHAARDAAQTLGKRVRLETASRTPRLDSPVFAGLQEALLHLVRNAVAHGIEPAEERRARGKPPEGLVRLRIGASRSRLHIECEDDGRGIDTEAVRLAAVAKGWLPAGPAATLDMEAAIRLLLRGGVTTTAAADEVSGRGVGLDVVRAAVARLRGELAIRSTPGGGTVVALDLPTALSATEVLAVQAGGGQWLLPLASVQRVLRPPLAEIRSGDQGEELQAGDQVLPYAALHRLVLGGVPSVRPSGTRVTVVIMQGGAGTAAVGVDRLLGTFEAIIRPLPVLAEAAAFVVGASLDASGTPRLVLDAEALVGAIRTTGAAAPPAAITPVPVLIVDDSLTTRMLEQSILEAAGYTVDLAVSGEAALEQMRVRRYGLLLVDVEMPGMDGFALVEHLRREPAWREIPAILVTSRESPEDRRRGLAAGAQDYVIKGEFDQRRLLQRIGELLS